MTLEQPYLGRLLALDAGAAYHHFTFHDPSLSEYFDEIVYLDDLTETQVQQADAILIPCRTPAERLLPLQDTLLRFADRGGLLVVMGETQPDAWLMPLPTEAVATNYWWWLKGDGMPDIAAVDDQHDLFSFLSLSECRWHLHALHQLPPGYRSILNHGSGQSVLFEGRLGKRGHLILTSLDPIYHHGSFFMPATTAFLNGFLPWIRARLIQHLNGDLTLNDSTIDCT